jgi:DNA-binding IclR family transcriptional regulator
MVQRDDQDLAPKFVGAVMQATSILRTLARMGEPAGVAAIAREAGVSASTCFNILRTLANERLISFDPAQKTYQMGLGVLEFTVPLLGANQADLIRPELIRLSQERPCLVCLWHVTDNERIVLVDRVSSGNIVRIDVQIGSRLPAAVGAVGRCYAANQKLSDAALRKQFARLQWQSPPGFEEYKRDVAEARRTGYAFDPGNLFRGVDIAGALVTDTRGTARFGLSVIAISGQMKHDDLKAAALDLRDAADWISETLFGAVRGQRQIDRRAASEAAE